MHASGGTLCLAIGREDLVLGSLVSTALPEALGITGDQLQAFYHDTPVRTCKPVARPDLHLLFPERTLLVM